jgi:tetratricopeptide (TPR) repeat protein
MIKFLLSTLNILRFAIIVFVLSSQLAAQENQPPEELFAQAAKAYENNDYTTAADFWQQLVDAGYENLEVYFNLGNAFYKLGKPAAAILNWERAALINPYDRDVRTNLEIVRNTLADELDPEIRLALWDWLDKSFQAVPGDLAAILALVFLFLAALVFSARILRASTMWTPVLRTLLLFFLTPGIICLLFMLAQVSKLDNDRAVIVMCEKLSVLAAPSAGAMALFDLHEGSRVKYDRSSSDGQGSTWWRVELPDGRTGWTQAENLEIINRRLKN